MATSRLSVDDRQSLALLLAPFLIVALSLASQHILRTSAERAPAFSIGAARPVGAPVAVAARPVAPTPEVAAPPVAPGGERSLAMLRRGPAAAPQDVVSREAVPLSPTVSQAQSAAGRLERRGQDLAALDPAIVTPPPSLAPVAPPVVETPVAPPACTAGGKIFGARMTTLPAMAPAQDFGPALARAALAQLDELVIYNARYASIGYPMGDVAPIYGVCTDVVVRAYRALGIDLQELIVTTRSGRGDRHIDHRRVEVVRRFLERHGEKLPISEWAEDYRPGDIVTYYRPQNRTSTSHIAIVTDRRAPSGRLMIVHNRGWGPQLEDALLVDQMTGHYRFTGMGARVETAQPAPAPKSAGPAAQSRLSVLPTRARQPGPMSTPIRISSANLIVAATGGPAALCLAPGLELQPQQAAAGAPLMPAEARGIRSASAGPRSGNAVTSR